MTDSDAWRCGECRTSRFCGRACFDAARKTASSAGGHAARCASLQGFLTVFGPGARQAGRTEWARLRALARAYGWREIAIPPFRGHIVHTSLRTVDAVAALRIAFRLPLWTAGDYLETDPTCNQIFAPDVTTLPPPPPPAPDDVVQQAAAAARITGPARIEELARLIDHVAALRLCRRPELVWVCGRGDAPEMGLIMAPRCGRRAWQGHEMCYARAAAVPPDPPSAPLPSLSSSSSKEDRMAVVSDLGSRTSESPLSIVQS